MVYRDSGDEEGLGNDSDPVVSMLVFLVGSFLHVVWPFGGFLVPGAELGKIGIFLFHLAREERK